MAEWKPGVVHMETTVESSVTLTGHRCWHTDLFKQAREHDAAVASEPTSVRFLSETEFKHKGGK